MAQSSIFLALSTLVWDKAKFWFDNITFGNSLLSLPPLSDLTMVTTSGKSRASCSAANAAPLSASTRQRPWRCCRPTARRRTSSSQAHHLTPALPTVPPVLPKIPLTLSFATSQDWLTHREGSRRPLSMNFELLSVNLYNIFTSDWKHGPLNLVRIHKALSLRTRCTIKSWKKSLLLYSTFCKMNSRGQQHHAQSPSQGQ